MDLSALRQSLHRLSLLEEATNGSNFNGDIPSCNEGVQAQQFRNEARPGHDLERHLPQADTIDELIKEYGSDAFFAADGDHGAQNQKKSSRHSKSSRSERLKGESGRSPTRKSQGLLGGGIRVYEGEADDWILSTAAAWESAGKSDYNKSPLMRIRILINGVAALLCVSMGSNINVLKPEIAKRARLSVTKLEPPVWVSIDTGSGHGPGAPVDYKAVSAPYQIDDFFAQDDFHLTPELKGKYVDGIVGIDWLEKYKPTVNYRLQRIELIDLSGRVHVIESAPGSERGGRGENECNWISARTWWDWDMKEILRGHYLMETDRSLTAS